ncbi:hypothetical protein ASPWEDRAFT_33425 [Aspergillus wentii DTO 134E9]|uniref:2EXR domain-containing protein n=1 Tax=Aspergillus wentii DTO 134E9 TaxID=1073089 RepID=A0A1L9RYP8_ASPWE|nr:uncharacterized protein ASPWEDRAFT_33425 [Aspergillus wentii DTO 134E9]KAI9932524.1 hypothetical protein MW887_008766 [Aspergillus wentii]OJJ40090.1 hypothetical protein ASPWEDRAFT_33425 [Aspergillus wentii DTO 134E9]
MSKPPRPSPYTYTDEKWKVHTVHPPRYMSTSRIDGITRPTRPARVIGIGTPSIGLRTAGERAAESDMTLWASCESVEEYERKRRDFDAAKTEAGDDQPAFHPFPRLPIELRHMVWEMVMAEPTEITITCSGYTAARRSTGWCGTVSRGRPRIYATTAFMPALMLVNKETYALASRHYRRAFRGVNGGGGVLAAYPSILSIEKEMIPLLPMEDLEMLTELVVVATPQLLGVEFSPEFSERLKTMLGTGSIRRLEVRLTRAITSRNGREVDDYFASLFAEMKAVDMGWVAPELSVGPVKDESIDQPK